MAAAVARKKSSKSKAAAPEVAPATPEVSKKGKKSVEKKSADGKKTKRTEEPSSASAETTAVAEEVIAVPEGDKESAPSAEPTMEEAMEMVDTFIREAGVDEAELDRADAESEKAEAEGSDAADASPEAAAADAALPKTLGPRDRKRQQQKTVEYKRGSIILRRCPYKFVEPQIKEYFSQFGRVRRVAVVRHKKTNVPNGLAFVEFEHRDVAKIVARDIPKYIFEHQTMTITYAERLEDKEFAKQLYGTAMAMRYRPFDYAKGAKRYQTFATKLVTRLGRTYDSYIVKLRERFVKEGLDHPELTKMPLLTIPPELGQKAFDKPKIDFELLRRKTAA